MKNTGLFWWIDRWRKSSAFMDMTLEEQGAYRNLLDEAHLRGGPLPNDERILAKACGDALAWPRVGPTVMARFHLHRDGWRNATMDEIYSKSAELSSERAESGRIGGKKSGESRRQAKALASQLASSNDEANEQAKTKQNAKLLSMTDEANREANGQAKTKSPSPSPSPSLISVSGSVSAKKERTAPAAQSSSRQPVENIKIITKLAHEVLKGLNGHAYLGADVVDEIKTLCAQRKIVYDSDTVRRALDSAEVQRKAAHP